MGSIRRWVLPSLLALVAVTACSPLCAEELDDLGLDDPVPPKSSPSPAPSPKPSIAVKDDDLDLGDEGVVEQPAGPPRALPGGIKDAWNLVGALGFERANRVDRGVKPPFKRWQALRFQGEVEAVLAGESGSSGKLVELARRRMQALLSNGPEPDSNVERCARDIHLLDQPGSTSAREAAGQLAANAGDGGLADTIAQLSCRGPSFSPYQDRARVLLFAAPGVDWITSTLASGRESDVEAVAEYLSEAAGVEECRELLSRIGKLPSGAASRAFKAIGELPWWELVSDLEKAARGLPSAASQAAGEAIGRLAQLSETVEAFRGGDFTGFERREMASRQNELGLIFFRGARLKEACRRFRIASNLDPADPSYVYNTGSTICRLGGVAPGVELMRRAIEMGGEEPRYYVMVVAALRELGRRDDLVSFLEARSRRARYSAILATINLNLAREYIARGEAEKALCYVDLAFTRAVPDSLLAPLLATRGEARLLLGQVEKGRRAFQQALAFDPKHRRSLDGVRRVEAWSPIAAAQTPRPIVPAASADLEADPLGGDPSLDLEDSPQKTETRTATPKEPPKSTPKDSKTGTDPDLDLEL